MKQTPGQLTGEANFLCSSFRKPSREPSESRGAEGRRKLQVEREVEHRQLEQIDARVDRKDAEELLGFGADFQREIFSTKPPGLYLKDLPVQYKTLGFSIESPLAEENHCFDALG